MKYINLLKQGINLKKTSFTEPNLEENVKKQIKFSEIHDKEKLEQISFDDIFDDLNEEIKNKLKKMHFFKPTPIQIECIPLIIQKCNVVADSPTGSGKTLAYILPIIINSSKNSNLKSLIICPTFELSQQIYTVFTYLTNISCSCCLYANTRVFITSPNSNIPEDKFDIIILDEVDCLFEDSLKTEQLLKSCSSLNSQFIFLSATLPDACVEAIRNICPFFIRVSINAQYRLPKTINHDLKYVSNEIGKIMELRNFIISDKFKVPCLIFVNTEKKAEDLVGKIEFGEVKVKVLTKNQKDEERIKITNLFRLGKIFCIITTDILSRGMDFKNVKTVINYDFPENKISFLHRCGRTGRVVNQGNVLTFYTEEELSKLRLISGILNVSGCSIPKWVHKIPKTKTLIKKKHKKKKSIK